MFKILLISQSDLTNEITTRKIGDYTIWNKTICIKIMK